MSLRFLTLLVIASFALPAAAAEEPQTAPPESGEMRQLFNGQDLSGWEGDPQSLENQRLEWVDPANAASVGDLLPATLPPLRWLQLPTTYGISAIGSRAGIAPFLGRLEAALARGVKLVQFREPQWPDGVGASSLHEVLQQVLKRCRAAGAEVLDDHELETHARIFVFDPFGNRIELMEPRKA